MPSSDNINRTNTNNDNDKHDNESLHIEHVRTEDDPVERAKHEAAEDETLSAWSQIVANPKLIGCAVFANMGTMMYGFDTMSLSLCLSMPAFESQFGSATPTGPVIPAYWQSLWNALAQVACMLGAWGIGHISDMFGRRICFFLAGLISVAGIAILYIADSSPVFLAGKMVNGLALGMALATGGSYVSEISPRRLRGILLSAYTFSMNLGLIIAASIAFSRMEIPTKASYKVLFAAGWAWPIILVLFAFAIPESPNYLVRKGKTEQARRALQRLFDEQRAGPLLAEMQRVHAHETFVDGSLSNSSFLECFQGTNWRRTRIILYCNGLPQMVGATFLANAPYFLVMAGMDASNVGMIVEIGLAFAIASSIVTWLVIGRVGRRAIILAGTAGACVFYLMMGIASAFPAANTRALWAIGIALELTWWIMGPTTGPSVAMAGEVSQMRLRAQSQSIGFAFNYFYSTVWNVVVPYMFNADEGNLGGKMGWIYLATSLITLVLVYYEFPETKDRSYEELDEMFEQNVPARKFATWKREE